jgi:hypothetical protein
MKRDSASVYFRPKLGDAGLEQNAASIPKAVP